MLITFRHFVFLSGLIASLVLSSCTVPTESKPTPSTLVKVGSLSLKITAIAPWLAESQKSLQNSRAFLYATSARVSIKTSGGSDVISPVNLTTSLTNSAGTTTGTLSTIGNIVTGTNYTVTVELFNSAVSTVNPVVTGTTTGVTITADTSTTIDTTCVPNLYSYLYVNAPQVSPLPAYSEKWYRFSATGGLTYTVKKPAEAVSLFVFSSTGVLVSDATSADQVLTPATNTIYYLGVATGATAYSPSILISTPLLNEGSVASPVGVTLDTNRTFKLGTNGQSDQYSYYQFTTTTAGVYYLVIDSATNGVSYYRSVYTDSSYTTLVGSENYFTDDCSIGVLAAATTYYLKIRNNSITSDYTARILQPSTVAANSNSEGTVAAPVAVSAGTPKAFTFGGMLWDKQSYYTFTTGDTPTTSFNVSGLSANLTGLPVAIYSDPSFTSFVASISSLTTTWYPTLAPNTVYYFTIFAPSAFTGTQGTGTLTISSASIAFAPMTLDAAYSTQTVSGTPSELWYEVTVPTNGTYQVAWDDSFEGSGTKTLDLRVSAYSESWEVYFAGVDSGYLSPSTVVVPSGKTKIRVKVAPFSGSAFTSGGTFGLRVFTPSIGSLIVNVH